MELIFAIDLRRNLVVHGKKGERVTYKPLEWRNIPTAVPLPLVQFIAPKFLYIADLDRIEGIGSHDEMIMQCAKHVTRCYVDRGCSSPDDRLAGDNIENIVGTETAGSDLSQYHGGYLSIDVKNGKVIPYGEDPVLVLSSAKMWDFDGCILLNLGEVGTESGVDKNRLERWRDAYDGRFFYGGGIATTRDLEKISKVGYDGAIIATAVHRGSVPLAWIRRGTCC